jgi:hypothetical protein
MAIFSVKRPPLGSIEALAGATSFHLAGSLLKQIELFLRGAFVSVEIMIGGYMR